MSSSASSKGDLISYGQIVLFGDSITEQSFDPQLSGHGAALANAYTRKLDVINRGFSGYTTNQAAQLLDRIFPARDENIKLVVFFFGANDAVLPDNEQHVPLKQYQRNCEAILTSKNLKGKVIAVSPPPVEEYSHKVRFGPSRTAKNTQKYGDALREICQRHAVPFADVWSAFIHDIGHQLDDRPLPGSLAIEKNALLAAFFSDGLHPVSSGYRIVFDTIFKTICDNFPNLQPDRVPAHTPYWGHAVKPAAGQLTRWRINTKSWTYSHFESRLSHLPLFHREAVLKFHFPKDRYMALASCILQRHFISTVLGRPASQIGIIPRDKNNRPYYTHQSVRSHDFNVSHHAGSVVLVGVLDSGRVGVDVTVPESLKSQESADEYLSSFVGSFTAREWSDIAGSLVRFSQHWALKEAYVKAIGSGIVIDLTTIEFRQIKYVDQDTPLQAKAAIVLVNGVEESWAFELHFVHGTYIAIAKDEMADDLAEFSDLSL